MDQPLLAPFTARDGDNLAIYDWPMEAWQADDALPPRAVVLIVHGLGEHAGRYDHVARQLLDWGFAVRAYDQRGHGESGGARGGLPSEAPAAGRPGRGGGRHAPARAAPAACGRPAAPLPLILLGHSMGGLVAARFVSLQLRPVDGLVLSSPALDPGLNALQKLLLATLPAIAPNLRVGNGLKPEFISHDPQVVSRYQADPLVHDRSRRGWPGSSPTAGPATVARAPRTWRTPTLLMYAGADKLVNPAGSRAFAEAAARHGGARS